MDRDALPGVLLVGLGVLLVATSLAYPVVEHRERTLEVGPVEDPAGVGDETVVWAYDELSPAAQQAFDIARADGEVGTATIYGDGNVPSEFAASRLEWGDRGGYVEHDDRTYLVRVLTADESPGTQFVLPLGVLTGAALAVVGHSASAERRRIVPTVLLLGGIAVLYWLLATANVHGFWTPVGG